MARPPSTTTTHLLVSLILFLLLSLSSSQSSHFKRTPPRFPTIFPRPNKPQSTPKQQQKQQQQQQEYKYETRYLEQRLDHFSFSDDLLTFQRRYLINAEHWVGPDHMGPIFLYCGNEGEIVWLAENTGLVWELAPQFWRHGHLP